MKNRILKYCFSFIIILFIGSCSVKKNTSISRTYHNLTAHYNAYFNGRDAHKQGVKKTDKSIVDNFSLIIPVFPHSSPDAVSGSKSDMDKAIKKSSKVIKLHSITAKPKRKKGGRMTPKEKEFYNKKEYCKWVDDSWLLMGKSHFYKHDFYLAKENFEYIIKEYSNYPIKFDAMIWLARTYNELKEYRKAADLIERAEGDKDFPRNLKKELTTTYADFYLKQRKYEDAIPKLVVAVKKEKKKKKRARYMYILAQIYQKYDQYQNASNLYKQVIKSNPPYEMSFSAKINRATSFDVSHGDSKEIKKQLRKMLRDDKNIEYQDQIYYAIANIEYKEGNIERSIELYKKSAENSTINPDQKALSFLAIADIYFSRPDYINSQMYYDSTIVFLTQEYPDYDKIALKSNNLTELITHLNIVNNEDSLQMLAKMSEKERFKIIDKLIQEIKDEEERLKLEQQQQQQNLSQYYQNENRSNQDNSNQGGKWYFYNPSTLSFGRSQFIKKWGNRKLEDNWRRKNKSIVMAIDENEFEEEVEDTTKKIMDNKTREFYLQDLPLNDSLLALSHDRIQEGLYRAAGVYKDKLLDFPKSIETYGLLLKRYPENEYLLDSYYQLYKLNVLENNKPDAEKYKNLIVNNYPKSNYANALTNPNYLQELEEQEQKSKFLYLETYNHYLKSNYFKVIKNCNIADSTMQENPLLPKFSLLKALSIGSIRDLKNFKRALRYIIKTYPKTDEKTVADVLFAKVNAPDFAFSDSGLVAYNAYDSMYNIEDVEDDFPQDSLTIDTIVADVNLDEVYSFNESSNHFYVIIVDKKIDINRLKFNVISYNIDYFSMFDFNVSAVDLDDNYKLISVKMLDSKRQAMAYFNRLKKDKKELFNKLEIDNYTHFIISPDNYSVLFGDKNVELYMKFFSQKYLTE